MRVDPSPGNGLTKPSTADTLQTRSIDLLRFDPYQRGCLGTLAPEDIKRVAVALAAAIEYEP